MIFIALFPVFACSNAFCVSSRVYLCVINDFTFILPEEIKEFIGYFSAPNECITGYKHTRNVVKVIEEYYKEKN